jgi:hypothetical protein
MASGVLYGQRGQDTTVSQNGLLGLTRTTTMHSGAAMYSITPSLSVEQFINNDPSVDVTYDPANKSYVLQSTSSGVNLVVDALSQTLKQSDKDPVKSDASFTVYHSGATDARILNPGSDNPAIALTYTSFAEVTKPTTYGTYPSTTTYYVPFGGETLSYQMPLSGKATYSGVVYGQGWDGVTASESKVSGASKFSVDFGTGAANMVLSLNATSNSTNATRSVGDFNYLGGGCNGPCGSNQIGLGDNDPGLFNSLVTGKFFGPNAAEFGATFFLNISATDGHAEHQSSFTGVTVGKKDP